MERHLYHYTYVQRAFSEVVAVLHADAAAVLQKATDGAVGDADEIVATLRVRLAGFDVGIDVSIHVGASQPLGARTLKFPLTWVAARSQALFPSMEGQLEVAALSNHPPLTQLTFVGTYDPPFGFVGLAGDAMAGHRVAEAAVHRFVEEVAARITDLVDTRRPAAS